jgi:hypothetical protein
MEVYLNNGLGGFVMPPVNSTLPCDIRRPLMRFADFNHDGNIDFVFRCADNNGNVNSG